MAAISLFWYCLQRAESYINCSCTIARSHSNGFFSLLAKKPWNFLCFYFKKPKISQFLSYLLLTSNRSLCCPIWPVIILVIKQIRLLLHGRLILLITCMITDRLDFTQSYYHYKYNVFVCNMRSWSCTFGYESTMKTSDPGLTPCYLFVFPFWEDEGKHISCFWYENKGGGWALSAIFLDAPLRHQR